MSKYRWICVLCLAPLATCTMPPQWVEGAPVAGQRGADERNAAKGGAAAGQPAGRGGGPGAIELEGAAAAPNGGGAASNRIFAVLDGNSDGIISAVELRKAVVALKTLDADGDGAITMAEASATAVAPAAGNQNPVEQTLTQFDKNRDGRLTADEVPPEMATMFRGADVNGDSALSRDELAGAMAQMQNMFVGQGGAGMRGGGDGQTTQRMMQEMMRYDRNGDGKISPNELPQQLQGVLQGADRNGDGAVDPQEMAAHMAQIGQRMGRGRGGDMPMGDARGPRRGQ